MHAKDYQTSRERQTQREDLFRFLKADEGFFDLQILTSAPLGDSATSFARTSGAAMTAAAGRGTHWREEERAALLTVSPLHSGPAGQQHFRASLPYWTE